MENQNQRKKRPRNFQENQIIKVNNQIVLMET